MKKTSRFVCFLLYSTYVAEIFTNNTKKAELNSALHLASVGKYSGATFDDFLTAVFEHNVGLGEHEIKVPRALN